MQSSNAGNVNDDTALPVMGRAATQGISWLIGFSVSVEFLVVPSLVAEVTSWLVEAQAGLSENSFPTHVVPTQRLYASVQATQSTTLN